MDQLFEPDPDRAGVGNECAYSLASLLTLIRKTGNPDGIYMSDHVLLDEAIKVITALRRDGLHVHSITNLVAQNFTANVLLACGATVSMTANPDEICAFVSNAKALHINLGTLDNDRIEAISKGVLVATENAIPVTLDPVMVHVSEPRRALAGELLPAVQIIRGNEQEIDILRNDIDVSKCLARTGRVDEIHYSGKSVSLGNGDILMDRVIATGCALGALISALSSKTSNPMIASLAGIVWFSVAGEIAAKNAEGPGSFQTAFLDELHNISEDTIRQKTRLL